MRPKALNNNQLKKALLALIIIHELMGKALHRSIDAQVPR